MIKKSKQLPINALFLLSCNCILDGCHNSHPGRHFITHGPGGTLWCEKHGRIFLVDVISLLAPDPL